MRLEKAVLKIENYPFVPCDLLERNKFLFLEPPPTSIFGFIQVTVLIKVNFKVL